MLASAYASNAEYDKASKLLADMSASTKSDWATANERFQVLQMLIDNQVARRQLTEAVTTANLALKAAESNKNQLQKEASPSTPVEGSNVER